MVAKTQVDGDILTGSEWSDLVKWRDKVEEQLIKAHINQYRVFLATHGSPTGAGENTPELTGSNYPWPEPTILFSASGAAEINTNTTFTSLEQANNVNNDYYGGFWIDRFNAGTEANTGSWRVSGTSEVGGGSVTMRGGGAANWVLQNLTELSGCEAFMVSFKTIGATTAVPVGIKFRNPTTGSLVTPFEWHGVAADASGIVYVMPQSNGSAIVYLECFRGGTFTAQPSRNIYGKFFENSAANASWTNTITQTPFGAALGSEWRLYLIGSAAANPPSGVFDFAAYQRAGSFWTGNLRTNDLSLQGGSASSALATLVNFSYPRSGTWLTGGSQAYRPQFNHDYTGYYTRFSTDSGTTFTATGSMGRAVDFAATGTQLLVDYRASGDTLSIVKAWGVKWYNEA